MATGSRETRIGANPRSTFNVDVTVTASSALKIEWPTRDRVAYLHLSPTERLQLAAELLGSVPAIELADRLGAENVIPTIEALKS